MPTKDSFDPDYPLPLFLADEPEQQGIGKAWERAAVISSRVLKASILVATATAIGIAILSVGNPVTLFADVTASIADVTASLVDKSALQPGTDRSMSTIQSTADAQALPPTAKDAPTRDEVAAVSEPAGQSQPGTDRSTSTIQSTADAQALPPTATDAPTRDEAAAVSEPAGQRQTENSEVPSETLFRQFQAWMAEQDAQAQVGPVQPVQDAPARVAENARAPLRSMQRHQHVRPVHHARAEIQPVQNPQKKIRREQTARVQVPPAQDARAQDQSAQNAQAPSFLPIFGWRN
ncbi:hypothetical protein [Bradyrhizobium sp. Ec3.3]|uniref:hypothetical protein n=1 Tax=Bradyrhizobium sp. Ec3.3 TaxID=189753 RepID=UPI000480E842|nr:hypothetical protein [Bradyrhizobium sp. Ec3.3]